MQPFPRYEKCTTDLENALRSRKTKIYRAGYHLSQVWEKPQILFRIYCITKVQPVAAPVDTALGLIQQTIINLTRGYLTYWGRVTHICINKLTIIGSDNGFIPGWRQAIIWTNAGILLIQNWGTSCSQILNEIYAFSFKKMHLKMSSVKWL